MKNERVQAEKSVLQGKGEVGQRNVVSLARDVLQEDSENVEIQNLLVLKQEERVIQGGKVVSQRDEVKNEGECGDAQGGVTEFRAFGRVWKANGLHSAI